MNKVHRIIEPEPPPPPHPINFNIEIKPEPPKLHKTEDAPANSEVKQWLDDATHSANRDMENTQVQQRLDISGNKYTPFVKKLQYITDYNKRLLQA